METLRTMLKWLKRVEEVFLDISEVKPTLSGVSTMDRGISTLGKQCETKITQKET